MGYLEYVHDGQDQGLSRLCVFSVDFSILRRVACLMVVIAPALAGYYLKPLHQIL
jgi:hypothetical protein